MTLTIGRETMRKLLLIIVSSFIFLNLIIIVYFEMADFKKNDVIVAVLDSGIDPNHEVFNEKIITGLDLVDKNLAPIDYDGHGTHVAGIITSQAPDAKILPIRVLNDDGIMTTPFTSLGILYAIMNGSDIINMSFSTTDYDIFTTMAIKYGERKGVIFVGSAGNQNTNHELSYPGRLEEVITVGAADQINHTLFPSSNFGEKINFLAPGANIKSATIMKDKREHPIKHNPFIGEATASRTAHSSTISNTISPYEKKSGTSMAAAHMTGTIAFLKTINPHLTKDEIIHYLSKNSYIIHADRQYKMIEFEKIKNAQEKNLASNDVLVSSENHKD